MSAVRAALRASVIAIVVTGCADMQTDEGELTIESSDPIRKVEGALELPPGLTEIAALPLCATVSDTYASSPWSKEFIGNARCVKQTTIVPAIGFGTDHETSASFPEFTGLNIAAAGEETPAQKCRKAGIRVSIRWTSSGEPSSWNFEVNAVPKFGPSLSTTLSSVADSTSVTSSKLSLLRVVSCVATHTSGLGGHGPGQFVISTTPFTGQPVVFPTIAPFRPMTSRVEAIF